MANIYISPFLNEYGDMVYGLAYMYKGKECYLKQNNRSLIYYSEEDANRKFQEFLDERKREDNAIPFSQEETRAFLKRMNHKFRTAKTYQNFAPHQYMMKSYLWGDDLLEFERFIATIKDVGQEGRFYSQKFTYLFLDGYAYWACGYDNFACDIINRSDDKYLEERNGIFYYNNRR